MIDVTSVIADQLNTICHLETENECLRAEVERLRVLPPPDPTEGRKPAAEYHFTSETLASYLDKCRDAWAAVRAAPPDVDIIERCARIAEEFSAEEHRATAEPDDGISIDSLAGSEAAGLIIAQRIRAMPLQGDAVRTPA